MQNVFSPLIGVICSSQAEEICHKNNLTFAEMLQPFSKLTSDGEFIPVEIAAALPLCNTKKKL